MPNPNDAVVVPGPSGGTIPMSREDAALLGRQPIDPGFTEAPMAEARRRRMFDTTAEGLKSLAEGALDAFSLGTVGFLRSKEDNEEADYRAAVNPGQHFIGELIGTGAGLGLGGPVRAVAGGGEALGRAAARAVLGEGEHAILSGALREAGAGALLTGVQSFNHQLLDTVVEDRQFSGEAILDDIKLGGIIGGIGGGLMGAFGSIRASRGKVAAQADSALSDSAAALDAHEAARAAYGEALAYHEAQLGAMKEFREAGRLTDVSEDFIRVREAAVKEAREAQAALREVNAEEALSGKEPGAYKEFQRRWTDYRRTLDAVNDIFTPHPAEVQAAEPTTQVRPAGSPAAAPAEPAVGGLAELDALVAKLPMRSSSENATVLGKAVGRLSMSPPPADTVVEALPAGAAARAIDRAAEAEPTAVRPRVKAPGPSETAERLMSAWQESAEPRVRPLHQAQARVDAAMQGLYSGAGGRLDSARSLGLLEADGIRPSADNVGAHMDGVYAMNRARRLIADEARGRATPLRDALRTSLGEGLGAKVARGLLGEALGGHVGALIGFSKFGGKLASSSGLLALKVAKTVGTFLTATRLRAVTVAATNTAWSYSERGPIEDPVERIEEIRYLAANPEAIRSRVQAGAGDLVAAAPDQVKALEDRAVSQMTALALRAPAIYFDKVGRPLSPPAGKLRAFFEFENATNDLPTILTALKNGSVTRPQVEALQVQWPAVYTYVVRGLLNDPGQLQGFDRSKLRVIEMVTGMSLTGASDPQFMSRQQAVWMTAQPQQGPSQAPQAFKLRENQPTPAQASAGGRAPGNY